MLQETERKILASGINLRYLPGEYLFRQGQTIDYIFFLLKGKICLEMPNKDAFDLEDAPVFLGLSQDLRTHPFSTHTLAPSDFLVYERGYFEDLLNEFDPQRTYLQQVSSQFSNLLQSLRKKENHR